MSSELDREILRALEEQNRSLRAILALLTDMHVRDNPDIATSRFLSIDSLLSEAGGLKNVEIGAFLGKTPQAVGQVLARKGRTRASD